MSGRPRGDRVPELDDLLSAGALTESLEERRALAAIESRFFGRAPRAITLSRYVLLDRLGTGGVGTVYRAFDPELDRKVAIKLLLSTPGREIDESDLLHEAQAMARLSHENVIAVHDVGTYREHDLGLEPGSSPARLEIPPRGVFVVMELVEGLDLAEWSRERPHTRSEILDVFLAAGRGLAAAHEAGLVHRDFKPHNVRVGEDGRVRVLDFGLARRHEVAAAQARELVGTPAYMSPEQHRGEPADARSDQFAFGVSLYEALTGRPPFSGTLEEMGQAKRVGRVSFRAEDRWPKRLRELVERSLDPDPGRRFASMPALLAELARVRGGRRREWVGAALLAGGIVGGSVLAFAFADTDPCEGARARVEQVWNDARRQTVRDRLRATNAPWAETSALAVGTELDAYMREWERQHRDACEATQIRREQSSAMLDLRMACLDRHMAEAEAVIDMLAQADASVAEHAVPAVNALGWLGSCEDLDALRWRVELPQDERVRERVESLYAALARARASELAGRYELALAQAQAVAEEAAGLDYAPLSAAADLRRGAALQGRGDFAGAERALLEAIWAAEASREESVATDAWIRLVWVVGVEQGRAEEGHRWAQFAEAALQRRGRDPLREATLNHNRAGIYYVQGRKDLALEGYQRALEVQTELLGADDPVVARTLNHIGNVLIQAGRLEEARSYCARSLALREKTLGDRHPLVAASLNNLAVVRRRQADYAGALELAERALAIVRGSGTPEERVALSVAADALRDLGRPEESRLRRERARAIEAASGENSP